MSNRQPNKDALSAELERICKQHGGRLRPSDVVEAARNPKSPLHDRFEWDIKKAAQEHWLLTARHLISSVVMKVVRDDRVLPVPLYVHTGDTDGDGEGYRRVSAVKDDAEAMRRAMTEEFSRAHSVLGRAESLADYFGMQRQVQDVMKRVARLKERGAVAQHPS